MDLPATVTTDTERASEVAFERRDIMAHIVESARIALTFPMAKDDVMEGGVVEGEGADFLKQVEDLNDEGRATLLLELMNEFGPLRAKIVSLKTTPLGPTRSGSTRTAELHDAEDREFTLIWKIQVTELSTRFHFF